MTVYSYKCPNCGASLKYNPEEEKLSCEYCSSSFTKEEIDLYLLNNPDKIEKTVEEVEKEELNSNEKEDFENNVIHGYTCNNCGAEVVTDDTTLTTFCYYCHSPVVIVERGLGSFKPDYIIPFKISENEAKENFLKWAKSKRYVPKSFYSSSQLSKITGMYLPYWSVEADYDVEIRGKGYNDEIKVAGDYEIKTTNEYDIDTTGNITIDDVSELAYSKVERNKMDSITPYNFKEKEDFKFYYLNGFFSEIYDIEREDITPIIDGRLEDYKNGLLNNITSKYQRVKLSNNKIEEVNRKWNYVLLPTWMLTYKYNDEMYVFTMNGQTSKFYGDLPIDKKLVRRDQFIAAIIIFILALIGGYFLW